MKHIPCLKQDTCYKHHCPSRRSKSRSRSKLQVFRQKPWISHVVRAFNIWVFICLTFKNEVSHSRICLLGRLIISNRTSCATKNNGHNLLYVAFISSAQGCLTQVEVYISLILVVSLDSLPPSSCESRETNQQGSTSVLPSRVCIRGRKI